jgi:anaerobic ribonucleoside-triphosphate reductase activating protein
MEQYDKFAKIVKLVKKFKLSIWSWTGYTWEELLLKAKEDKNFSSYLKTLDVVVDGRFILSLKSDTVKYRGSSNQRIIDVKKSLKANKVIQVIV